MVQIDFHLFVEIFRTNYQDVIIARGRSYPGVKCYGGGHHKAVVIVGMFADQVHASRRSGNHGSSPKRAVEPVLYELETIIQQKLSIRRQSNYRTLAFSELLQDPVTHHAVQCVGISTQMRVLNSALAIWKT
jgi:hypothetical protein